MPKVIDIRKNGAAQTSVPVRSTYTPLRAPNISTVVLCGHAPTSREMAQFNRPDAEFWTMNDSYAWIGMTVSPSGESVLKYRMDRWFEVHAADVYRNPARRSAGYVDFLRAFKGPVYMQDQTPGFPTSVRYPLEQVADLTEWANLETQRGPFGSSFGWMIALALLEGFTTIEMYGCDLSANEEYKSQRPSTYYWVGRCEGAGVKFILPNATPLLDEKFYGRNITVSPGVSKDMVMNKVSETRQRHAQLSREAVKEEGKQEAWAEIITLLGMHN